MTDEREQLIDEIQKVELPDKSRAFGREEENLGWYELYKNEVVMNYLRERLRIELDDVRKWLLVTQEQREIMAAQTYGDMKCVKSLLDKAEMAASTFKSRK